MPEVKGEFEVYPIGGRRLPVRYLQPGTPEWHLIEAELKPAGNDIVILYRTWCQLLLAVVDVELQPTRHGGFCLACTEAHGAAAKAREAAGES